MNLDLKKSKGPKVGLALGAAVLAASWLVVRYKTAQAERDHPPTGEFITVDIAAGPIIAALGGAAVGGASSAITRPTSNRPRKPARHRTKPMENKKAARLLWRPFFTG